MSKGAAEKRVNVGLCYNGSMQSIRTHTTLRTLFTATATFAVVAAVWTAAPGVELVHLILTPCAASFIAGLFGMSLGAGFLIGLVTILAVLTYANAIPMGVSLDNAGRKAMDNVLAVTCLIGLSWLTASWWGVFLRYTWSKPKVARKATTMPENDSQRMAGTATLLQRIMERCEITPVGIFIVIVLACILIAMIAAVMLPFVVH
jgi:hypothetical protein